MLITINADTGKVTVSSGSTQALTRLDDQRGKQACSIEYLVEGQRATPDGISFGYVVKANANFTGPAFDGDSLIAAPVFTLNSARKTYDGVINYISPALNEAFKVNVDPSDDVTTLTMGSAFGVSFDAGVSWTAFQNLALVLTNNIFRGDEGTPDEVPDANSKYLRFDEAQTLSAPQKTHGRSNLGFDLATDAQARASSATDKVLTASNLKGYVLPQALSITSGEIDFDVSLGNNAHAFMNGSAILNNPTNLYAGAGGMIEFIQDSTGGRAISSFGNGWSWPGGTPPSLSTDPGAVDVLTWWTRDGETIRAVLNKAFAVPV